MLNTLSIHQFYYQSEFILIISLIKRRSGIIPFHLEAHCALVCEQKILIGFYTHIAPGLRGLEWVAISLQSLWWGAMEYTSTELWPFPSASRWDTNSNSHYLHIVLVQRQYTYYILIGNKRSPTCCVHARIYIANQCITFAIICTVLFTNSRYPSKVPHSYIISICMYCALALGKLDWTYNQKQKSDYKNYCSNYYVG
jgi:hypothetical protein